MNYERVFDASGNDSLAKLARWVRPGGSVLELGSASGYFTAFLASQASAVDIVEIDADAAAQAARHARRSVVADLDGDDWIAQLCDLRYETIVCADVLEHLRDGRRLLERLRGLLAPGGELLLSVPNVAHSALIVGLVDDRFEYGGEGLLDPTHVRLYTWRSLAALLHDCGYGIRDWDATTLSPFDTEFRVRSEALPAPLRDALAKRPWGAVYQWLVRAAPGAPERHATPPPITTVESVPVRLLHAATADGLSLEHAIVARLPIGESPSDLAWRLQEPSAALRLLLADRIGLVHVLSCRLLRGEQTLWSFERGDAFRSAALVRTDATTFALTAPDAWIEPDVPPEIAERADRLVATLAWPAGIAQTGEFAALGAVARVCAESVEAVSHLRERLLDVERASAQLLASETAAHAATRTALENVQAALSRRSTDFATLEHAVDAYRAENARLDAAVTTQERIIAYRQSLRWWLRLPFVRVKLWWHRLTNA